jgi:3-oxoacyl-[acyl-carrier-protein] synthase-3
MGFSKISGYSVEQIVGVLAPKLESNEMLLGTDAALFFERTGIRNRWVEGGRKTIFDYFFKAASCSLEKLTAPSQEITVLICITQTPDIPFPNLSNRLQHALRLSNSTICLDINLGCSGYVYGLHLCMQLLSSTAGKKALLLTGDLSTAFIPTSNTNLRPLFSDAVAATIVSQNVESPSSFFNLLSYGAGSNAIQAVKNLDQQFVMEMQGLDVFNFSFQYVAKSIIDLFGQYSELGNKDDIDFFVFHQANKLIIESIKKQLKIVDNKLLYSIGDYGNTAVASIPITLISQAKNISGQSVVFSGFGVGFSVGTCVLRLPNNLRLELLHYDD